MSGTLSTEWFYEKLFSNHSYFLTLLRNLSCISYFRKKDDLKLEKEIEDIEKNVTDLSRVFKDSDQLENAGNSKARTHLFY